MGAREGGARRCAGLDTLDIMRVESSCAIDNCRRPKWARGWCSTHYQRWRKTGSPLTASCRDPIEVRFWRSVDIRGEDECWEWRARVSDRGYGVIDWGGEWVASRLSYHLTHGPIPNGVFICHHCDNRRCVNPLHLYAGDAATNGRDKAERGRCAPINGELNPFSKLTAEQVAKVRESHAAGATQRALSRQYGVSQSHIGRIVRREAWSHV